MLSYLLKLFLETKQQTKLYLSETDSMMVILNFKICIAKNMKPFMVSDIKVIDNFLFNLVITILMGFL